MRVRSGPRGRGLRGARLLLLRVRSAFALPRVRLRTPDLVDSVEGPSRGEPRGWCGGELCCCDDCAAAAGADAAVWGAGSAAVATLGDRAFESHLRAHDLADRASRVAAACCRALAGPSTHCDLEFGVAGRGVAAPEERHLFVTPMTQMARCARRINMFAALIMMTSIAFGGPSASQGGACCDCRCGCECCGAACCESGCCGGACCDQCECGAGCCTGSACVPPAAAKSCCSQ